MEKGEGREMDDATHGTGAARHRLWLLGALLVVGSCMLAVVHLSTGLHAQLVANRKMVRVLRDQLATEAEERDALLRDKDASMGKTATLRTKSKLVTDELLEQLRKSKHLQQELLLAREDLGILSKNCTLVTQRLRDRYEVTLRALHDRVVHGQECRTLLERNVEERAKVETSLMAMQDRAYNLTVQLKSTKQKLRDVVALASQQRDEMARLRAELEAAKAQLSGGGGGLADAAASASQQQQQQQQKTASAEGAASAAVSDNAAVDAAAAAKKGLSTGGSATADAAAKQWREYTDKASGRVYWYNTVTKKSQWDRPAGV